MGYKNQKFVLAQVDAKIKAISAIGNIPPPGSGWIHGIRMALNMTLDQLAGKVGITAQSLKEAEQREVEGTIMLKTLNQIAQSINMRLFYAVLPVEGSLEQVIEKKIAEKAKEIVETLSSSMSSKSQQDFDEKLHVILEEKKHELRAEMPRYLWE